MLMVVNEINFRERKRMKLAILFYLTVFFGFIGWVSNCVWLVKCDFEAPYKAEAIRGIGVFVPPIGAVVGWMHIED